MVRCMAIYGEVNGLNWPVIFAGYDSMMSLRINMQSQSTGSA